MQLPTLIVAGAQKCGTSTLAAALREHPQIFMARPKELHYFDRPHQMTLEEYAAHFTPGPGQTHAGEATPVYMYNPAARRRMARTLPGARIVVVLRDPAKRAYSHYWHERRRGTETLATFEEALAAEPQRLARGGRLNLSRYSYVDRGRYIGQLEALAKGHGRENLHVLLLDELISDPSSVLTGLLEFLDVDASVASELPIGKKNAYRVTDEDGSTRAVEYPPMTASARASLVELFRRDNDLLSQWWGRDLSAWNRV